MKKTGAVTAASVLEIAGRRRIAGVVAAVIGTCFVAVAGTADAETVPQPTRGDIQVRRLLVTEGGAQSIRLVKDPRNDTLYLLKQNGDVFRVDLSPPTKTLVYSRADHGVRITQGMAIGGDGTIYLVGNGDAPKTRTRGRIVKGVVNGTGGRTWSILAQTAAYPRSATAYDHRLNGIVVEPGGQSILVNSGSRTDHGEEQSAGGLFPGLRESGVTACILRLPTSGRNLVLPDNRATLRKRGYIFAEGTRNTFDMAYGPNGDLFGSENGPDRDMPDELNWLRAGRHYGFPWRIGGLANPQQFSPYDPAADKLLNPMFNAVWRGYYHDDPQFPQKPVNLVLTEPIANAGPNADSFRSESTGAILDASTQGTTIASFTAHRTPLGLVFDREGALGADLTGDGFILGWTVGDPTGDTVAGPFKDPGQDLLHLQLTNRASGYRMTATRIVGGFNNPIDAELVGHTLYVLDNGGSQSIWEVILPAK
ncbi:MAG: PQQ-dependent sugar dehydrogenase [Rhodospirillales bacterium]